MSHQFKITDQLTILCRSSMETLRCETFWIKEPETLEWIKGFHSEGIFIDVGANVGVYSLFAASLHKKMKIISVEPLETNIVSLKDNIQFNGFHHVTPLHLAVADQERKACFYIMDDFPGSSGSQIDMPVTEKGIPYNPIREEEVQCTTIDHLCSRLGISCDYLKIDIDGQEWKVLKGAEKSLKNSIQSVLVELNSTLVQVHDVHGWMLERGFGLDEVLQSLPNHSNKRRRHDGPLNYIYSRLI